MRSSAIVRAMFLLPSVALDDGPISCRAAVLSRSAVMGMILDTALFILLHYVPRRAMIRQAGYGRFAAYAWTVIQCDNVGAGIRTISPPILCGCLYFEVSVSCVPFDHHLPTPLRHRDSSGIPMGVVAACGRTLNGLCARRHSSSLPEKQRPPLCTGKLEVR